MRKINIFGSYPKRGRSLDVFMDVKEWFALNKNIELIAPYYTVGETERRVPLLQRGKPVSFHNCEICGKPLAKLEQDCESDDEDGTFENTFLKQKKHMIFISCNGVEKKEHFTCNGISRCFNTIGWSPVREEDVDLISWQKIPSFDNFINVIDKDSPHSQSCRMSYDELVVPFIQKWRDLPISRSTYLEFQNDLWDLTRKHKPYYQNVEGLWDIVVAKIFFLIGIEGARYG